MKSGKAPRERCETSPPVSLRFLNVKRSIAKTASGQTQYEENDTPRAFHVAGAAVAAAGRAAAAVAPAGLCGRRHPHDGYKHDRCRDDAAARCAPDG